MAVYQRMFVVGNIASLHRDFLLTLRTAEREELVLLRAGKISGRSATLVQLRHAYNDFNRGLREAAQVGALAATTDIRSRLRATQVRADTRQSPHLRDLIRCRPLSRISGFETGGVGVADLEVLEQARNRVGSYGSYWRAQEYGTGASGEGYTVPTQVGRRIHGYFFGPGLSNPEAPRRGAADPTHPIFRQNEKGGPGEIRREIRGRHYVRDGANLARSTWEREILAVQSRVIADIRAARGV